MKAFRKAALATWRFIDVFVASIIVVCVGITYNIAYWVADGAQAAARFIDLYRKILVMVAASLTAAAGLTALVSSPPGLSMGLGLLGIAIASATGIRQAYHLAPTWWLAPVPSIVIIGSGGVATVIAGLGDTDMALVPMGAAVSMAVIMALFAATDWRSASPLKRFSQLDALGYLTLFNAALIVVSTTTGVCVAAAVASVAIVASLFFGLTQQLAAA